MHANWRSQAAQDALTQFLADAIVEAAKLRIKGVRQDALLFKSLVAMLEDKNEEIGTIPTNTLMPIRDHEFRGDLGRSRTQGQTAAGAHG
jgi:hypothetical protein